MSAILVVVEHVLRHQPFEMPLIQDDHVVKQVSPTTPNPTLSNTVGKERQLHRMTTVRRNISP